MNDRQHPDELVSASLSGELGFDERAQLEAHLAACPRCRALRADFLEQRRLLGGMRREPAPQDLAPRLQAAIASGATGSLPWWRRPGRMTAIGAAAAAVLLLGVTAGLALQGGAAVPDDLVGGPVTPSATAAVVTPTPDSSPSAAPTPTATLASTPAATEPPPPATPAPTQPPPPATEPPAEDSPLDPGSVAFVEVSGEPGEESLSVREPALDQSGYPADLDAAETLVEPSEWSGPPTSAELSPDGDWLAYQTQRGLSGITDVWAVRLADGELISLGESHSDTPFTEQMAWSHDGHRLAYTLVASVEPGGIVDVWIFDSDTLDVFRLTEAGNAYAASFQTADQLWISVAGERPVSYRLTFAGAGVGPTIDGAELPQLASQSADGVFQPLFSPDARHAIFWRGQMDHRGDATWSFSQGGMPYLATTAGDGGPPDWDGAARLFPDLRADRDAFRFASIEWSFNSDDFAVWNTVWTGTPIPTDQTDSGEFPDPRLIYLGEASSGQLIGDYPYLDFVSRRDEGAVVRDVEFTPGPPESIGAIWATVQLPVGGDMDAPMAVLEVAPAGPSDYEPADALPGLWRGPAVYLGEAAVEESP